MCRYARLGVLLVLFLISCFGNDGFIAKAQGQTFTVNGKITQPPVGTGPSIAGVSVLLSFNSTQLMTQTDSSGNFSFANVPSGVTFDVTPSKAAFTFNPVSQGGVLSSDRTLFFTGSSSTAGEIRLGAASTAVSESAADLTVTVNRTGDTSTQATVDYATSDSAGSSGCNIVSGQASSRCDYLTTLGTLTFAAGESIKSINIPLVDDAFAEGAETFTITLSNAVGGTLGVPSSESLTINDNDSSNGTSNPVDDTTFFVRQHYVDFLNREPDTSGLNFWTNEINQCGGDLQCREIKRINVSAAFFVSIEFQNTGYLVYRVYKAALGDLTNKPVAVQLVPFLRDTQKIGQGVRVGIGDWEAQLETNKQAYILTFVQRPEFLTAYPNSMTAQQFVDKLNQNAGNVLSPADNANLVAVLGATPSDLNKRAQVLRSVAEDADLKNAEFNKAFVLMQYFGYLRRNPDDAPDHDFSGDSFWLNKLNSFNGDYINAEMVKAFISSDEYRHRFGQ